LEKKVEEEEVKTRTARRRRKTLCIFTILRTRIHLKKSRLKQVVVADDEF
jgi:hypothetical protein